MVSIVSNFVEGYLKNSAKEKSHFLEISETSLLELESQGEICLILKYWSDGDYELFDNKRAEVGYLLHQYRLKVPRR